MKCFEILLKLKNRSNVVLAVVVSLLLFSCESSEDWSGQWKLIAIEGEKEFLPFDFICRGNSNRYSCEDILYITTDQIEYPLFKGETGFNVEDKFVGYEIIGNKVKFMKDSTVYEYRFEKVGEQICFEGGYLCLERAGDLPHQLDSTIFAYTINDPYWTPYSVLMNIDYNQDSTSVILTHLDTKETTSIQLLQEEITYIKTLLERIPDEDLNKIYNNGVSDCSEISIDFYTKSGNWKGVETCGWAMENTFELTALIINLNQLVSSWTKLYYH